MGEQRNEETHGASQTRGAKVHAGRKLSVGGSIPAEYQCSTLLHKSAEQQCVAPVLRSSDPSEGSMFEGFVKVQLLGCMP